MNHEERTNLVGLFRVFIDNVFKNEELRIACCRSWSEHYDRPDISEHLAKYR